MLSIVAGMLLIPYGFAGSYRATALLQQSQLPWADCALMALLGVALIFGGLGLLMGTPAADVVLLVLLAWRGLAVYNARLQRGRLTRRDFLPAAVPDLTLAALIVGGIR